MHPISAWAANVQSEIGQSTPVYELTHAGYDINFYTTGDSLWMVTRCQQNNSRLAFRCAFALQGLFEMVSCDGEDNGLRIKLMTGLGQYETFVEMPDKGQPILHYTTSFTPVKPIYIPFWPRDILPLTQNGNVENTSGTVHVQQVGPRSGQLYMSLSQPKECSLFYFQNLSAMSDYCQDTGTTLSETVGGRWPELGFRLHPAEELPLQGGKTYIISDAYIALSSVVPQDDFELTRRYLDFLATMYLLIPRPETTYHNWPEIAAASLEDLTNNKGCWTHSARHSYLNAYLCDYKTPPEIMVQLAVLLPLREYMEWSGTDTSLNTELLEGLPAYFDGKLKTVVRWLPSLEKNLDESEEQKKAMVMDSWYLHHPLMNLSRLALQGDETAKKLLLGSIDYAISVAHHFNYQWPVFYKMDTLEVLKEETAPGDGGEHDVAGAYGHLMLQLWHLTGDKKYFNEAKKALLTLKSGFRIFYQANNTAFAAGALLEMYKETGDDTFLNLSYCCIAGIMKNVQLWEAGYGYGKNYGSFFGMFPLNDAPYTAAYEEHEVFAAFHQYLSLAEGMEIMPSVRLLLCEFIKYIPSRLAYYFPTMLPRDMISEEAKTGEVDTTAWLPVEDLKGGWEKSGDVGQEVYGAGIGFAITPRQYYKVGDEDFILFSEYPLQNFTKKGKAVTLLCQGDARLSYKLIIIREAATYRKTFTAECIGQKYREIIKPVAAGKNIIYNISGNIKVRLSWS